MSKEKLLAQQQERARHAREALARKQDAWKASHTKVNSSVLNETSIALEKEAGRRGITRAMLIREILDDYAANLEEGPKSKGWRR